MQFELARHAYIVDNVIRIIASLILLSIKKKTNLLEFIFRETHSSLLARLLELVSSDSAQLVCVYSSQIFINCFPFVGDFRLDICFTLLIELFKGS